MVFSICRESLDFLPLRGPDPRAAGERGGQYGILPLTLFGDLAKFGCTMTYDMGICWGP